MSVLHRFKARDKCYRNGVTFQIRGTRITTLLVKQMNQTCSSLTPYNWNRRQDFAQLRSNTTTLQPTLPALRMSTAASGKRGTERCVISLKFTIFGQVSLTCILELNFDSVVFQPQSTTVACKWRHFMTLSGAELTYVVLCIFGRDSCLFRSTG